ncbi:hypothetical protein [Clostridium tertium]|uniref:Uncharacterized protein n=1 Tax=Clostridium tertium TaxID=1559 RepID=A0A6N3AIE0_9CLOT
MSDKIKTWLYIVGGILLIGIVAALAFKLLFLLFPVLLVLYLFFKIRNYFRKDNSSSTGSYTKEYETSYNNDITNGVDDSAGDVIDVDYEDVDK